MLTQGQMDIDFVTAFTPSIPLYREAAELLQRDCDLHEITLHQIPYDDRGGWGVNCRLKPSLYRGWMREHMKPAVFIDADSRILRPPVAFLSLGTVPMAAVPITKRKKRKFTNIIRATPLYLTPAALDFMDAWCELCEEDAINRPTSDHAYIPGALDESGIVWGSLPASYCEVGGRKGGTVILTKVSSSEQKNSYLHGSEKR